MNNDKRQVVEILLALEAYYGSKQVNENFTEASRKYWEKSLMSLDKDEVMSLFNNLKKRCTSKTYCPNLAELINLSKVTTSKYKLVKLSSEPRKRASQKVLDAMKNFKKEFNQ